MTEQAKQEVVTIFDQVANRYDNPSMRFFPFCADRLIAHLQPRPGNKLLDVATGTGAVALAAAQAIGPEGRVQAIDLAENMLQTAMANLRRAGLSNVDFHLMDAESVEFKSRYFDCVTCSFGIFFLPDMQAGLTSWRQVLKPGGRVMFTSFTANAFQPLAELFRQRMQSFGIVIPQENWMRLTTEEECLALLHAAGFANTETVVEQLGYHLNAPEDWWEIIYSSGFRGYLEKLNAEQQGRFRVEHLAEIQSRMTDKGLWLDVETLFSTGIRPE
ncbi:MAG: class I SAM-dependent methyltransferase [Gammaproteobacteria bacterium]